MTGVVKELYVCGSCGSINDRTAKRRGMFSKAEKCNACGSQRKVALKTSAGQELISRFQSFTSDFPYQSRRAELN